MSYQQTPHGGRGLDLVELAQRGDIGAFERLVERQLADLYRLAAAIVGRDDASDATHDALLRAWRELPRLRDPAAFEPWLRTILVNRCRNLLRERRRTVREIRVGDPAPMLRGNPPSAPDFRPTVEQAAVLDEAFEHLTPDQRAVLALHYVSDLTLVDVARTLGIPVGTAKSRLAAGLTRLRAALGDEP